MADAARAVLHRPARRAGSRSTTRRRRPRSPRPPARRSPSPGSGPTRRCGCGPTSSPRPACPATTRATCPSSRTRRRKAASAFDMVVGASSVYGGSWLEGAGAVFAENQALRWIADLAGLPAGAGGVFVPGGTVGNLSALVAARDRRRGGPRRPSGPLGGLRHRGDPLVGQARAAGRHGRRRRRGAGRRARPDDRRRRCARPSTRCRPSSASGSSRSWSPPARPTSASSTTSPAARAVAHENGWWLHVDGAYGGAGLAAPSVRALFDGIEHADSFIVDPHKWLFAPVRLLRAALPRSRTRTGGAHPARRLPRSGHRRRRVESVRLRDPAHPAGPRPAVLVLARGATAPRPTPTRSSRPWR